MKRPTFEEAKRAYVHRYSMDHKPQWAMKPAPNGKHYAPQYSSDEEWYANTLFHGETELADKHYCYSANPTWPKGHWL